jgi:phenylacetate-CoA ligase
VTATFTITGGLARMSVPLMTSSGPLATIGNLLGSMRRLEKEQWLSPRELSARRRDRLRSVLASAAAAPYYAAVLRQAGITHPRAAELEDLGRLPLLDKAILGAHGLDAFLTVPGDGLVQVQTSGSTGRPGRFLRSRVEEAEYSGRWWRVYQAYGCGARDEQINVAIVDKPDRAGPIALLRRMGMLPRIERVGSDTPPEQVLKRVQAINPPILTGYAGAIEALADHVLTTGAAVKPPRAVFCTAMEVTDRCLELAERAFQAPAVDVFVTNEFGVLAWSCPHRRDVLHTNDDGFIIEVLAPDGRPAAPGEIGELVVTSLGLTAMPLIRYRMGDMAARIEGRCECGRGLGLLTRVQGRTAHALRRSNGAVLTTPYITSLFGRVDAHDWVRRFQVREEPGRQLRFLLDVRTPPTPAQHTRLRSSVETAVGEDWEVEFEYVDRIPNAPTGKLQYVVPLAS